jgi:hypothetical protein
MPQILRVSGSFFTCLHVVWALWLLGNVWWNEALCSMSSPGSTLEVREEVRR